MSFYSDLWSCSKCDFKERTLRSPFRVKPKPGVYKSVIEYRWCNDCNGIKRCFIGKSEPYELSDLDAALRNSFISKWWYEESDKIGSRIRELEKNKKINLFFSFSTKQKELFYLKEAIVQCNELDIKANLFYSEHKPEPRCIMCGGLNVSYLPWNLDHHSCGGDFIRTDLGRGGAVGTVEVYTYNEIGISEHSIENLRGDYNKKN